MNTSREVAVREIIGQLEEGTATLEQVRALAADIGNSHYVPGIPVLISLLEHEDEIVRYNAIMSIAYELHCPSAVEKLIEILRRDPDEDCKDVAAGALGTLCVNTKDRRVTEALASAALNEADAGVRSSAYKSLRIVSGVSRNEHLELLREQNISVDAARVHAILRGINE